MKMRHAFVRAVLTAGLPIVLIGVLCREIAGGAKAGWLWARIEFDSYIRAMRRADY